MSERPKKRITISEFKGLVSNRGPFVGEPGSARKQVNIRSVKPGVLEVRLGMREVNWG